jgi:hypothetical protein
LVIPSQYDDAGSFFNGLARVQKMGSMGSFALMVQPQSLLSMI